MEKTVDKVLTLKYSINERELRELLLCDKEEEIVNVYMSYDAMNNAKLVIVTHKKVE